MMVVEARPGSTPVNLLPCLRRAAGTHMPRIQRAAAWAALLLLAACAATAQEPVQVRFSGS